SRVAHLRGARTERRRRRGAHEALLQKAAAAGGRAAVLPRGWPAVVFRRGAVRFFCAPRLSICPSLADVGLGGLLHTRVGAAATGAGRRRARRVSTLRLACRTAVPYLSGATTSCAESRVTPV